MAKDSIFGIIATLYLMASVYFDLKTKKVPNAFILAGFSIFSIYLFCVFGISDALRQFASPLFALALSFPLFFLRILGGGDVKVFIVFSLCLAWTDVASVLALSLIWGALLGIVKAGLDGKLPTLYKNMRGLVTPHLAHDRTQLQMIPFTVALFCGWLTHWIEANLQGGY